MVHKGIIVFQCVIVLAFALSLLNSRSALDKIFGEHKTAVTPSRRIADFLHFYSSPSQPSPDEVKDQDFVDLGGNFNVYSAYFDHRERMVRVFGYTDYFYDENYPIYCQLWYTNLHRMHIVRGTIMPWDSGNSKYRLRSAGINCILTENSTIQMNSTGELAAPDYVTLSRDYEGHYQRAALRVEDIRDQTTQYKFVVCIHRALSKNFSNVDLLLESIETNVLFGADKIVLYNCTAGPALTPFLNYYVESGRVDMYNWPLAQNYSRTFETKASGQNSLIQDCLYRYMYQTKYLILINLDELIVPRKSNTWAAMLEQSNCSDAPDINIRNVFFPINIPPEKDRESLPLNSMRHIQRQNYTYKCKDRSKSLARPSEVFVAKVHDMGVDKHKMCCLDPEIGFLQHYRGQSDPCPSDQGGCIRDAYMDKFSDKILARIKKVKDDVEKMGKEFDE